VDDVLELVELSAAADRPVRTYSLGMRQRLWLRGFLRQLARAGRTVLISSHVLAEVAQTVDSVLILSRGRLVAERRIGELPDAGALEALYLDLTSQEAS
jgi:ABC-2 type transport system ATP-binding protein